MKDTVINEKLIKCRCGKLITGKSPQNTQSNLKQHQNSKEHKKNMELIKNANR
jgi:hypothetical protein